MVNFGGIFNRKFTITYIIKLRIICVLKTKMIINNIMLFHCSAADNLTGFMELHLICYIKGRYGKLVCHLLVEQTYLQTALTF